MSGSYVFGGSTRSGKTWAMIYYAIQLMRRGDAVVLYVDPQPHGGGRDFTTACEYMGLPVVEENADTDLFLPCDLGTATGNLMEDEKTAELLMQVLFSYRGQGNAFTHPQTEQHARLAILTKMYSGLPWNRLHGMFYSDFNEKLIERVNHQEVIFWLLERGTSKSAFSRDLQPAVRLLSILMRDPSMVIRDSGKSSTVEILNCGNSISLYGGNRITNKALTFLCNLRIKEVERAAQEGKLNKPVFIVIEESELLGISESTAQAVQGQVKAGINFGIICQEPSWGEQTEVIMQNTNHVWFRSDAPSVLKTITDDLAALFAPNFVKRTRYVHRQAVRGYEEYSTESETKREKGESVTTGVRERSIYKDWLEKIDEYMSIQEQKILLQGCISQFNPGQCLLKQHGDVTDWQFPNLAHWIGRQRRFKSPGNPRQWLRKADTSWLNAERSLSSSAEDTLSPTDKQQGSSTRSTSRMSKTRSRRSKETSGHWSKVEISTLSGWLWPESEKSSNTEK